MKTTAKSTRNERILSTEKTGKSSNRADLADRTSVVTGRGAKVSDHLSSQDDSCTTRSKMIGENAKTRAFRNSIEALVREVHVKPPVHAMRYVYTTPGMSRSSGPFCMDLIGRIFLDPSASSVKQIEWPDALNEENYTGYLPPFLVLPDGGLGELEREALHLSMRRTRLNLGDCTVGPYAENSSALAPPPDEPNNLDSEFGATMSLSTTGQHKNVSRLATLGGPTSSSLMRIGGRWQPALDERERNLLRKKPDWLHKIPFDARAIQDLSSELGRTKSLATSKSNPDESSEALAETNRHNTSIKPSSSRVTFSVCPATRTHMQHVNLRELFSRLSQDSYMSKPMMPITTTSRSDNHSSMMSQKSRELERILRWQLLREELDFFSRTIRGRVR